MTVSKMYESSDVERIGHHPFEMQDMSSKNHSHEQIQLEDTTSVRSATSQERTEGNKRSTWRITLILIALFLSLFVAALDATIVATAVPVISHELNSATGYTWVGGAYLLSNCAAGPVWAKMSDIWGRKPIILSAISVFVVGSCICATAQSMPALIAGRAIQGSAGGTLILLVHICISDLFSVRQRSLIIGLTEAVWACAGGAGPILGGVFASLVSWRWCFWINLPICGIAFVLILLMLDIKHHHTPWRVGIKAIDWFGITTFLGFTLTLLMGLDFGGAIFPWSSAKVLALLIVGSLFILVFVYGEARVAKYPLMPLDLFKRTTTIAVLAVCFFHGLVFMMSEYYLPLFFQSVLGATPLMSGLLLLPFIVSGALAGIVCGFFIHRTGRFLEILWIGTTLLCLGTGLYLTWGSNPSTGKVVGMQLIAGTGSGLLFGPPLIAIQSSVQQRDMATATSTFTFIRDIAISLCVIVGGSVFQNSMDHRSAFLTQAGLPSSIVEQLSGKNAAANVMIANTIPDSAQAHAIRDAFSWSLRNMFILYTALGFCGVLAGLFVKKSHLAQEHTETATGIIAEPEAKG